MQKLLIALFATGLSVGLAQAQSPPEPKKPDLKERCAPSSDSRIRQQPDADGHCDYNSPSVRSYGAEELERADPINVNEALRKLDPRFSGR